MSATAAFAEPAAAAADVLASANAYLVAQVGAEYAAANYELVSSQ